MKYYTNIYTEKSCDVGKSIRHQIIAANQWFCLESELLQKGFNHQFTDCYSKFNIFNENSQPPTT